MPGELQTQPEAPRKRSRVVLWVGLAVGTGALLAIFVGVSWTRASAKRSACWHNLRSVCIAMHLYADENDGDFPISRDLLYPQYTDNLRTLLCPADPRGYYDRPRPEPLEQLEQWSSHVYLPGQACDLPGSFIVMYDKPGNHWGGGINVAHIDASVEWWPSSRQAEFLRRVQLQTEAVAKWRASGKPAKAFGEFVSPELQDLMGRPDPELQHGKAMW